MDGDIIAAKARHEDRPAFSYDEAFSRNLGWVTAAEQQALRGKRVAIAGMGGVGGSHLLTLARLGIGAFNIADFDRFELANFNRQAGATLSSIGQPKVATLATMARDINPELDLKVFPHGIDEDNLDAFLAGVDVYVDSLDFFVLDMRLKLFARLEALGIPAVIAAPIGMGTGYLVFMPGKMTFEQYFRLSGLPPEKQAVNFALGLTPRGLQRRYLMDSSRIDLKGKRGPSTSLSCELCAGVAAAEVLKIVLKRGPVRAAPWYHHFDAYRCKWVRGWMPGGNANPWQRAKLAIAYRFSETLSRNALPPVAEGLSDIDFILDRARWAPSGDNTQPWRFEKIGDERIIVHLQSAGDVYDYAGGEPTLLAGGFLLETLRLAASRRGRDARWAYLEGAEGQHCISVEFPRSVSVVADPLLDYVPIRSVDRRAYRRTKLGRDQKSVLEAALGDDLSIEWHESLAERWRASCTNARATDIRLRLREAYDVHRRILDFERDFSPTGIPVRAIGLDPVARRLMRWLMQDWRRIDLMNRFAFGTAIARLEMDLIPGIFCAAHFTVRSNKQPDDTHRAEFLLKTGVALQRFWLTATRLGLVMQPSLAPICFAGLDHTASTALEGRRRKTAARLARWLSSGDTRPLLFMGRIGMQAPRPIATRSVRRDAQILLREAERVGDGTKAPS
jgi:molybdopterin/thiamine biosynthesis adenylyltransferase